MSSAINPAMESAATAPVATATPRPPLNRMYTGQPFPATAQTADQHHGVDREPRQPCREHRDEPLSELERADQDRDVDAGVPVNVARADVAGAELAQVEAIALAAHQQPADRQPADQVGERGTSPPPPTGRS